LPAGAPAQLANFVELSVVRDPTARASAASLASLPFNPRATDSEFERFLRSLMPMVRRGRPASCDADELVDKLDQ